MEPKTSTLDLKHRSLRTALGWPFKKLGPTLHDNPKGGDSQDKLVSSKKVSGSKVVIDGVEAAGAMKERFARLLLGEDMSGCGNGVSTALAISNSITNLCGSVFGQLWRLEPLPPQKRSTWEREIDWLLSAADHIIELAPSYQTSPEGTCLEVMTCRPRSDLYVNLPALRKLDNMLLEILDGFESKDFWYIDKGIPAADADGPDPLKQNRKWWLPVPRVPLRGVNEKSRSKLNSMRDCANQIVKAAVTINKMALSEMEVPDSYLRDLPKNARAVLGDFLYRFITSDPFSEDRLLDCLDLTSGDIALEIANRVEASIYIWRSAVKSSWEAVKDLMVDRDARETLAVRAQSVLLHLKQRFPDLAQTTLDMIKIQHNTDVGKSILESYSRALETVAFDMVSRIDDVLYVDELTRKSGKFKLPFPSSPYKMAPKTPTKWYTPSPSPRLGSQDWRGGPTTPSLNNRDKPNKNRGGREVKRALANYFGRA
ncbi:hypothetical protein MLD38_018912 [Melastoma candidum]|uniref:Uncharacterized protein n=1 Tax=Melastoma candidum TaxID=119954 RepID=A0ACB9QX62_9MYRT|nr:hypothetical protein MLD38_018912 [Melastoma candidum]